MSDDIRTKFAMMRVLTAARIAGNKKAALQALQTPQQISKVAPTPSMKLPDPPSVPDVPNGVQKSLKMPSLPGIKAVSSTPKNMGASPMKAPADSAQPIKLAMDADGYGDPDAMSDEDLYALCKVAGLVGPEGTFYDMEKNAYVRADDVKITFDIQKDKDMELWRAYMAAPSSLTLAPLMRALQPVINSEVNRWAGNVPRPVLEMEAKRLTLEAIKSYSPDRGATLSTHVHNRLYKLSRTVYTNQDMVRMPENKKLKSQTLYNGGQFLAGELGREPTQAEMADHLGWNQKTVRDVQRSMVDEYVESQDEGASGFDALRDAPDPLLDYVYFSLAPQDQKIFEMSTGYNGQKALTAAAVAKKLNINANQVAYRRRVIADKVREAQLVRS